MNILKKMATISALKNSLLRNSKNEKIGLKNIRLKVTFNSNDGLKFFILNKADTHREENIYFILNLKPEEHKDIVTEAEEKLRDIFQNLSIEKKIFVRDMDIRFYMSANEKQQFKNLSTYLFHNNSPVHALKINDYL